MRTDSGEMHTLRTIGGRSETFSRDLTYVFTKNVTKARRENKAVVGGAARAPGKA